MIENKILSYLEPDQDFCGSCHRYEKIVEFIIRHSTELTTLYFESGLWGKRKINEFSQNIISFLTEQLLNSLFE